MKVTNVQNRNIGINCAKAIFRVCHIYDICHVAARCVLYSPLTPAVELALHIPPPRIIKEK